MHPKGLRFGISVGIEGFICTLSALKHPPLFNLPIPAIRSLTKDCAPIPTTIPITPAEASSGAMLR